MAVKEEDRLKKVLQDMSHSLNHIEDIMADDREILIKLVKQNNSIVEWLKQIEIDEVSAEYENSSNIMLSKEEEQKINRYKSIKALLDEFMSRQKDLIELEEELKKHKADLIPGQVGES